MLHLISRFAILIVALALTACGSIDIPADTSGSCQPGCISGTPKACVEGKEELLPPCQDGFECAPSTGQCVPIQADEPDGDGDGVPDSEDCAPEDPNVSATSCADGAQCGDDGCGGTCGTCADGEDCDAGQCVNLSCEPNCDARECGEDGCGGSCGTCNEGADCLDGQCEGSSCTPDCADSLAACGDDGCGGSCGTCDEGKACLNGECEASGTELGTIIEVATAAGTFTTLLSALEVTEELNEALSSAGPFTVFAPTDDAFALLPEGTLDELLEDVDALNNTLLYHVLEGAMTADMLSTLDAVQTLMGDELTITVTEDGLLLNDTVQVTATDVMASNGIIHVIDAVLAQASSPPPGALYCFQFGLDCVDLPDAQDCVQAQLDAADPAEVTLYTEVSTCCENASGQCMDWDSVAEDCSEPWFACNAGAEAAGSGEANCTDSRNCIMACPQPAPNEPFDCLRDCYAQMASSEVYFATLKLLQCEAEGATDCAVETVACNDTGPCVPSCAAENACGDNGCGESCGTCTNSNEECSDGTCICVPDCDGAVCGDDGCGGVCGVCADGSSCQGVDCVLDCTPLDDCGDVVCGVLDDGCDGYLNCGDCEDNEACTGDGQCVCIPDCAGKDCGDNGCGGSCGTCDAGGVCEANGQCTCTPDCSGSVNLAGLIFQEGNDISDGYITCLGNDEVYAFSTEANNTFVVGNMVSHVGEQGCEVSMNYRNLSDGVTQHFTGVPTAPGVSSTVFGNSDVAYLDLETGTHSSSPTAEADIIVVCCGATEASAGSVSIVFEIPFIWSVNTAFAEIEGVPFEGVGTDAQCGDDGCGGSCGTCNQATSCNDWQVCECTPTPATICVNNASWAVDSCGNPYELITTCPFGCDGGVCSGCAPACGNSECGSDGCGGSCGACTGGEVCNIAPLIGNQCVCALTDEVVCGANNGLHYADSCGNPTGDPFQSCAFGCANGACQACQPSCTGDGVGGGSYCGGDGCGGQCTCEGGQYCGPNSTCGDCWVDDHCPTGDVCATMNLPTFCADCVVDSDCKGANQACIGYTCSSLEPPTILINELDYDNVDYDGQEYLEIYNHGSSPVTPAQMTNVYLYVINSALGGGNSVSEVIPLAELLTANLPAGGYALLGTNALLDSLNVTVPSLSISPNTLPNAVFGGAGVALVIGALDSEAQFVIDSVHYESAVVSVSGFPAWSAEGSPAPTDSGGGSLSRCANGNDTNNNANNFDLTSAKTPGTTNSCSTGPDGSKD
ncbi:MAG: fasciclin domain-containing protein [Myxococcota bacterium]